MDLPHIMLGIKSDPIEYRYSFDWLFRLMASEGLHYVQMGSFFELYQLPDDYFRDLRLRASDYGIQIASLFTSHRELGGFLRRDPRWAQVTRRNYERLIEAGALMGARHVGSNPGAVMRDEMAHKAEGIACYLRNIKELMHVAHKHGIEYLTIEPMSCLAEPPALPEEIHGIAGELMAYHAEHPDTVPVGYCADISHGYADAEGVVRYGHLELFEAGLPYLVEFHVKNTDAIFCSTFGFSAEERQRGIVDLVAVRDLIYTHAAQLPKQELIAYLELSGPKLGRDYSDCRLEAAFRDSLAHMREVFG